MIKYLAAVAVVASAIGVCCFTACSKIRSVSSTSSSDSVESVPNLSNSLDGPVRIRVNDVPLNSTAQKAFPSPAIYDLNGDGSEQLVIGDLFGNLGVYANLNTTGAGDPVWSERKDINDAEGNPIESPNW